MEKKSLEILIKNTNEFNITHILECGQVFRFKKHDFGYIVYASDKKMEVICQKNSTKIFCDDIEFVKNYFDMSTNYANIKKKLMVHNFMQKPIKEVYGIRILKQLPLEMLISFIISANNNIPRIKKTLEKICEKYGTNMGDYYAFPTIQQLANIPIEFFKKAGAGYRDKYLYETIKMLSNGYNLGRLYNLKTEDARKELIKFKGVGRKVADCILLFGFGKTDVFPTDTWVVKVYKELYGKNLPANKVSEHFEKLFGENGGYAQQYLYYERMIRNKKEKINDNNQKNCTTCGC